MDFQLSDDHRLIQETIRKFVDRECPRQKAHELDSTGRFPLELLGKLAEMGFCGLNVPEPHGGSGQEVLGAALVVETLAAVSPALAGVLAGVTFFGGSLLSQWGSPEQQERWFPSILAGRAQFRPLSPVGEFLTAAPFKAGFLLGGHVPLAILSELNDCWFVPARLQGDPERLTFFIVPEDTPGVARQPVESVGLRGLTCAELHFDEVTVTYSDLLGGLEGLERGQEQADHLAACEHLATAAVGLGLAQGAARYTTEYARERAQFGQPILRFEAVQHMLVDLEIGVRAARWLLYHACWLADQAQDFAAEAAIAGLQASALARKAGLQGVQILGGYGYSTEYDAQRYLRDSLMIFSGTETTAILKNAIGANLGL